MGDELERGIEEKLGVVVPGRWFLLGFTNTFGAGRDIASFDDFKGARIRVPGSAGFIARYKELGAEGISIPFPDVPLALSQGTIDALLTTHETVRSAKLYEAGVKSVFIDQVSVIYYIRLVNEDFWTGLTEEQRKAFTDTWESVIDEERAEALRRQDSAAEENAANGIVIHRPDPADVTAVNERLLALVTRNRGRAQHRSRGRGAGERRDCQAELTSRLGHAGRTAACPPALLAPQRFRWPVPSPCSMRWSAF